MMHPPRDLELPQWLDSAPPPHVTSWQDALQRFYHTRRYADDASTQTIINALQLLHVRLDAASRTVQKTTDAEVSDGKIMRVLETAAAANTSLALATSEVVRQVWTALAIAAAVEDGRLAHELDAWRVAEVERLRFDEWITVVQTNLPYLQVVVRACKAKGATLSALSAAEYAQALKHITAQEGSTPSTVKDMKKLIWLALEKDRVEIAKTFAANGRNDLAHYTRRLSFRTFWHTRLKATSPRAAEAHFDLSHRRAEFKAARRSKLRASRTLAPT